MASGWYLSCGEVSAELHARELMQALQERDPSARFSGMGGDLLREAGMEQVVDSSTLRVMGITELFGKFTALRRALCQSEEHILATRPQAVICVDYPGFHIRLAKRIKQADPSIPIIQYISPKFWAWNYRRVKRMRAWYDRVLCILPFEKSLFDNESIAATFVGNPLLDEMDLTCDGSALRQDLGVGTGQMLVGIFPGSRRAEIARHMPLISETLDRVRDVFPDVVCAIALADGVTRADLDAAAPLGHGALVVENRSRELMAACDVALAKSGTTTLELAIYGTPMVIFYHTSAVTMAFWKCLRRIEYVGLPNILASDFGPHDEAIVPELIGRAATPESCAEHLTALLQQPARREQMRKMLGDVRRMLGEKGASTRAAEAILQHVRLDRSLG